MKHLQVGNLVPVTLGLCSLFFFFFKISFLSYIFDFLWDFLEAWVEIHFLERPFAFSRFLGILLLHEYSILNSSWSFSGHTGSMSLGSKTCMRTLWLPILTVFPDPTPRQVSLPSAYVQNIPQGQLSPWWYGPLWCCDKGGSCQECSFTLLDSSRVVVGFSTCFFPRFLLLLPLEPWEISYIFN